MTDLGAIGPEATPASVLADLAVLLTSRGVGTPGSRALEELADLSVAHEELRVVEEEMLAQRDQLEDLLRRHEDARRWHSHLAALVPVGLCTTDGTGKLLDANPALAGALGMGLHRLRGKPLSVYLDPADVPMFRSALRRVRSGDSPEQRLSVTVRGRGGQPERWDLLGFSERSGATAGEARVQWLLSVPATGTADPSAAAAGSAAPPVVESLGLAAALTELTALGISGTDRQRMLARMAAVVQTAVPAADWVSLTIGRPSEPRWQGTDSPEAQALDGAQLQAGQGPCWEAFAIGATVVTDDLTRDERWPRLIRTAALGPVRSVLAVPVRAGGEQEGVLNVYAAAVGAFADAPIRRLTELVGAGVTGVLESVAEREALRDLAANLERALASRAVIDQAKGVLMGRLGIDADDAFARMVALSNRINVKVRDLAILVVRGHADEVIAAG